MKADSTNNKDDSLAMGAGGSINGNGNLLIGFSLETGIHVIKAENVTVKNFEIMNLSRNDYYKIRRLVFKLAKCPYRPFKRSDFAEKAGLTINIAAAKP